ncbi:unnamed protein product [Schistocephalus solidus]|uniref:CAP_N domain-containing protein n=1 Tax=Schistocephalus solidus TaxID=70667 RepID=A0A183T7K8_SCHSO|nr:unnamed protein product [Schistocephalus solidus]
MICGSNATVDGLHAQMISVDDPRIAKCNSHSGSTKETLSLSAPSAKVFVRDVENAAQASANTLIQQYRSSNPVYVSWIRSWLRCVTAVRNLVETYYAVGLVWRPPGGPKPPIPSWTPPTTTSSPSVNQPQNPITHLALDRLCSSLTCAAFAAAIATIIDVASRDLENENRCRRRKSGLTLLCELTVSLAAYFLQRVGGILT